MTMRHLPSHTIAVLRKVLNEDGTFTDRDFIVHPGMGRRILQGAVDRLWVEPIDPEGAPTRRYLLTATGKQAITPHAQQEKVTGK